MLEEGQDELASHQGTPPSYPIKDNGVADLLRHLVESVDDVRDSLKTLVSETAKMRKCMKAMKKSNSTTTDEEPIGLRKTSDPSEEVFFNDINLTKVKPNNLDVTNYCIKIGGDETS